MTGSYTFAADEQIQPDGSWLDVLRRYVGFVAVVAASFRVQVLFVVASVSAASAWATMRLTVA